MRMAYASHTAAPTTESPVLQVAGYGQGAPSSHVISPDIVLVLVVVDVVVVVVVVDVVVVAPQRRQVALQQSCMWSSQTSPVEHQLSELAQSWPAQSGLWLSKHSKPRSAHPESPTVVDVVVDVVVVDPPASVTCSFCPNVQCIPTSQA